MEHTRRRKPVDEVVMEWNGILLNGIKQLVIGLVAVMSVSTAIASIRLPDSKAFRRHVTTINELADYIQPE